VPAEAYRRWAERDSTPLIPPFNSADMLQGHTGVAKETAKTKRAVKTESSPNPKTSPKGKSKP
jgi:threonine dehydratase